MSTIPRSGIRLIAGLGNPGPQYKNSRHNVGFWLVSSLSSQYRGTFKTDSKCKCLISSINIDGNECKLLLPTVFMNLNGEAIANYIRFYKIPYDSILVVHDELDFSPGAIRLKMGGGANGHNGIRGLISQLGSGDFWRLRIGIGKPQIKGDTESYVLFPPGNSEAIQIRDAISRALDIMPKLAAGNFERAMLELHAPR